MPATRSSTRIAAARTAVSAAPLSGTGNATSAPSTSATASAPPAAALSAAAVARSNAALDLYTFLSRQRPPARQYTVRNPLPFPEGDLYLDLGAYGSGYLKGFEVCPDGGEGYPVARFRATIFLRGPGADTGEEIGYVNARLIRREPGMDFYTMCDALSEELIGMASQLFDEHGFTKDPWEEWDGDILYIEEVILKPRYRGYGVGLLAVDHLIDQIPAYGALIVITAPCPLSPKGFGADRWTDPLAADDRGDEVHDAGQVALRDYYSRIGFQRMTTQEQERRTQSGLQLWGLWTGKTRPDIRGVVPHLF